MLERESVAEEQLLRRYRKKSPSRKQDMPERTSYTISHQITHEVRQTERKKKKGVSFINVLLPILDVSSPK